MSDLSISRIDVYQVDLPYAGAVYRLSGGESIVASMLPLFGSQLRTELKVGESTPFGSTYIAAHALGLRAGIAEIAPSLIGLDARRVDRINEIMDSALVGHEHAKTALDVACWDIFGKFAGMPVCDLLGGRTDYKMPIISSIPLAGPETMRSAIAKHREQGYICATL